ncbi:MAG: adenine-specific methyltransferase EcoRI family protein [Alloprevotella sp.]|nr:adenine-specific methyltransferase EcoRI family protein [Alloprevotella sp.]
MAITNLNNAKKNKKDEFYTQLEDISNELKHYRSHFRDKVVLCNCDDPYESNFFKYFALNFNALGLKKLIATCYDGSPVQGNELMIDFGDMETEPKKVAYKVEITEVRDINGDGRIDLADVRELLKNDKNIRTKLKEHGDFRSLENEALLQQADIVVTNPPFSLFRDYVAQLIKFNKKFLIIGRMTALHSKDIFPLIKENKLWVGYGFNLSMIYRTPYENTEVANQKYVLNKGYKPEENYIKVPSVLWLTNLDHAKRHEELILYKHYSPEDYPTYDNLDGIDVSEIANIPCDYDGIMGVPDTILGQLNPSQFEIVGLGSGNLGKLAGVRKNYRGRTDVSITINGKHKCPYSRILIRRKK